MLDVMELDKSVIGARRLTRKTMRRMKGHDIIRKKYYPEWGISVNHRRGRPDRNDIKQEIRKILETPSLYMTDEELT